MHVGNSPRALTRAGAQTILPASTVDMLLEKMRARDEEAGEQERGAEGTAGKNERSADLSVDSAEIYHTCKISHII